jgi:hypothetical protein
VQPQEHIEGQLHAAIIAHPRNTKACRNHRRQRRGPGSHAFRTTAHRETRFDRLRFSRFETARAGQFLHPVRPARYLHDRQNGA